MKNGLRILITGGAGFVGFHLTKHLLENTDATIVLLDNLRRGRLDDELQSLVNRFSDRVQLQVADLNDSSAFACLDSNFDQVFHLAAINGTRWFYQVPDQVLRVNILSLLNLLEWLRETKQRSTLCFTSSNEAYAGALEAFGELPLPTPETVPLVISDPFNPRWSYAGSKLVGEQLVIHTCHAIGIPAVVVRPHNLYGPRAGYDHVVPELCRRILGREDPFVLAGSSQTRTFCYIDDAVRALHLLANQAHGSGISTSIYNVGGEEEVTISHLAETLFEVADWRPQVIQDKPAPLGSVQRRLPDISKVRRDAAWFPEVQLIDGLRTTLDWYAAHPDPEA